MGVLLKKGTVLEQRKEPALSREIQGFFNANTTNILLDKPPVEDPDKLTAEEIISIAEQANIIDENDGKPLFEKLQMAAVKGVKTMVADAIDDEPFVSSQMCLVFHRPDEVAKGVKLAKKAMQAKEAYIAIYKNISDVELRIPKTLGEIPVKKIYGKYPAEYRAKVNLQEEKNMVIIGLGALVHLYNAVYHNFKQTTVFITVTGNCIANAMNMETNLNMPISNILERCGLAKDPTKVIIGGSMTGVSIISAESTVVTHTTKAILALREDEKDRHYTCIRCGRCIDVCPRGLDPSAIYHMYRKKDLKEINLYDPQMCIGCGTCSYICPSRLQLSSVIQQGNKDFFNTEVQHETKNI